MCIYSPPPPPLSPPPRVVAGRYSLTLPDALIHLFRGLASAEAALVSVDRLAQLSGVAPEPDGAGESKHTAFGATVGAVDVRKLQLSYNGGSSRALNGLKLRVQPGCKVAVVGRSGAGKVGASITSTRHVVYSAWEFAPAHRTI